MMLSSTVRRNVLRSAVVRLPVVGANRGCSRALLNGERRALTTTKRPIEPEEAKTTTTTTPSSSSSSSSGGAAEGDGMTIPLLAVGGLGVAGGAAYYFNLFGKSPVPVEEKPKAIEKNKTKKTAEVPKPTTTEKKPEQAKPAAVEKKKKSIEKPEVVKKPAVVAKEEAKEAPKAAAPTTPAVVAAAPAPAPPKKEAVPAPQPVVVAAEKAPPTPAPIPAAPAPAAALVAEVQPENKEADKSTVEKAIDELKRKEESASMEALRLTHAALRANVDDEFLKDLDSLEIADLKVRVMHLVAEMNDRTKWEAVRLKELVKLKEKEVSEKFIEVLQKQRHELEDLMAKQLREQEDALTRQSNALLREKEAGIQALVEATSDSLKQEHEAELESTKDRLQKELEARYEVEFGTKLTKEKESFGKELADKLNTISELTDKLRRLDEALKVSRSFESDSQRAHRVSAAALALATKLETSEPPLLEIGALQGAASEDGMIAAALSKIPATVAEHGVPTLPELQLKFEKVRQRCREAAFVPEGVDGLQGQLLGKIFSLVTIPPSPTAVTTIGEGGPSADLTLTRAAYYLHSGDLVRAVEQLDKLEGQAAFTVKDWKDQAKNRLIMDHALRVIKVECALLNKNMAGGK